MTNFHFIKLANLYSSKAYKSLVSAIESMESPIYPDVKHVPALIVQTEESGSDQPAAKKCLEKYFTTALDKRDQVFAR